MKKILLVEDDRDIIKNLTLYLKEEGFYIENVDGQRKAIEKIEENQFDLILLDISLKEGHGFSTYNEIKSFQNIPIIFLTASNDEFSVVTALDLGADDYISKPFRPRELLSRIQNVLRRYQRTETFLSCQNIKVDTTKGLVFKDKEEIFLSALEYKLLLIFLSHQNKLLTRDFLLDEIWNITGEDVSDNTLTVYVKRIRSKIEEDTQNPQIIKTVRGLGYKVGE